MHCRDRPSPDVSNFQQSAQHWLLYLQQLELKFCPGKSNPADYPSRHTIVLGKEDEKKTNARDLVILSIIQDTTPVAIRREEIQKETQKDQELRKQAAIAPVKSTKI